MNYLIVEAWNIIIKLVVLTIAMVSVTSLCPAHLQLVGAVVGAVVGGVVCLLAVCLLRRYETADPSSQVMLVRCIPGLEERRWPTPTTTR